MSNPEQTVSTSLFFTEGSSDKEYNAEVVQKDGGWVCNFSYGRRGSALKTGTKTQEPVSWDKAFKAYTALVASKTKKGYTPCESGARYVGTEHEAQVSGLVPSLPTAIRDGDLEHYMTNDDYVMQEKFDGENRMLSINNHRVAGANRRGLTTSVRENWKPTDIFAGNHVLCGEDLGETFAVFDITEIGGEDITGKSMMDRVHTLNGLLEAGKPDWMMLADTAIGTAEKRAMFARIDTANGEGVVFKLRNAPYEEGRTLNMVKYKIQESATFVVTRINDKRSVGLGLYDSNEAIEELGNVTVPVNHELPKVGDLVEVGFMYRYEAGSLEQPKYKGVRTDLGDIKPSTDQIQRIKHKKAA